MVSVLLLENKPEILSEVTSALTGAGFRVRTVPSALEALALFRQDHFDLILSDFEDDACAFVTELRATDADVPFIVLSASLDKSGKRQIYRSGADGYVAGPVDCEELLLKIKNLLWRCHVETETVLTVGDCSLHSGTMSLETPEKTVELRRMEYLLLEKLLSYPGHIFTRNQLLDDLWGYDCESGPRTVDTHIKRLRKNLKGVEGIRIRTIRGIGYQAAIPRKARNEEA